MGRSLRFADPEVTLERRSDGTILMQSRRALASYPPHLGVVLRAWAERAPERVFLAERSTSGTVREVSYGEAYRTARVLASSMLEDALGPARPVMVLSDNAIDHALITLAAHVAGVPVAPISAAYSLVSRDHAKLRALHSLVQPGWVYAEDGSVYARALTSLPLDRRTRVVVSQKGAGRELPEQTLLSELIALGENTERLERAWNAIEPEHIAKLLFTSGSTGAPKGVINTHRMLCSNQQALAQGWLFLSDRPPVVVDWLPWSHTFGGNHNFNLVLWHGGTLWVDRGKPVPGRIEETVGILRHVSPTLYFNVPRGFDALLPYFEQDDTFAEKFFGDLDLLFFAGAALPRPTWDRLIRAAARVREEPLNFVCAWGTTETSPMVTQVHFAIDDPSNIGVPAPGTTLKLVPNGTKLEARVKGPQVTPGYLRETDDFRSVLDDEGFYPTGDAVRLADEANPNRGIVFDGRVSENFKLSSGTWVHVGALRIALIRALAPFVQDAVIAGHDRDAIGILLFPDFAACASAAGLAVDAPRAVLARSELLRSKIADALRAHNADVDGTNSQCAERAILLEEPPSIDAGEITDKGYINQRAVLERRAAIVQTLFDENAPNVIHASSG